MIQQDKEQLITDLQEKKDILTLRIDNITKQEEKLKNQAEELQQKVMKGMKQ